jgi:hypothetical protein
MPGDQDVVVSHCLSWTMSRRANVCASVVEEVVVVGVRHGFGSSDVGAAVCKT